jgi:hypothetical protein
MKAILLVCFASLAANVFSQNPDTPEDLSRRVHVELQAIALPTADADALLPDLRDPANAAAAWSKLDALITDGKAKRAAVLTGQTIPDKPLKLSNGEEIRFPLHHREPWVIEPRDKEGNPADQQRAGANAKDPLAIQFNAEDTWSRLVGVSLTIKVHSSAKAGPFYVTAEPEHTWLLKWDEFEIGRFPNNEKILLKQPRFASANVNSTFAMTSGETVLLSAHRIPGQEGQTELFQLRVWNHQLPDAPPK